MTRVVKLIESYVKIVNPDKKKMVRPNNIGNKYDNIDHMNSNGVKERGK